MTHQNESPHPTSHPDMPAYADMDTDLRDLEVVAENLAREYVQAEWNEQPIYALAASGLTAAAALRAVLEIHADAGASQGYTESGYGDIEHVCAACGSPGEYG